MNSSKGYHKSFSESDQSAHQERSTVTSDFNCPSKDYISKDSSAQVMSTENDGQTRAR